MRRELMDILACPVCKGSLELQIETQEVDEILQGSLYCKNCQQLYLIENSIPILLPPKLQ